VSDRTTDRRFMRRALAVALRGRGTTAPNPMVGAVVVQGGRIIGDGVTQPVGQAHAEVMALRAAGADARGSTVYCTLEPCAHTGRTPPCVDALIAARVARVVFGARDPNPAMRGGAARLAAAGIEVLGGVEEQAALDQNPAFFHQFASDRPYVTLKLARSLDGGIADGRRLPVSLTGPQVQREVHAQRADHDAVAVGVGTAIADNPRLTVRAGRASGGVQPMRVVFDRTGRLPMSSRLVDTVGQSPVLLVADRLPDTVRADFRERGVSVIEAVGLPAQLRALRLAGLRSLYCEGGATLADALLAAGLVDRLVIFTAPVRLGADAVRPLQAGAPVQAEHAARHRLVAHRRLGDDLMAIYDLTSSVHRTR
jgi:diaminohydroxyphosphoribosylaminopyrimidine deaminase / 5-amino-6-(5-phosphoribosylamino)uracil reductase